ncbi:MAG: primosomal protein N' [Prevotellaceae bacterium]|jgi:primosomal protein N' (replication factor Y)|nr:primosomal protein N' [Prevotellaceae bacterium]
MEYVNVILPLALPQMLTYAVPGEFSGKVQPGMRVEVEVGRKHYRALVYSLQNEAPQGFAVRPLRGVTDLAPVVTAKQFELWKWIASYYMCTMGEVMTAALPNGLRTTYKPRTETFVRLHESVQGEAQLGKTLNALSRAKKQEKLLLDFLDLTNGATDAAVSKKILMNVCGASAAAFNACVEKHIFDVEQREVGRLDRSAAVTKNMPVLSAAQQAACDAIKEQWQTKDVVLLHGVTASGKTEIYAELMAEELARGNQVLYLVPEIALTTQLIGRLQQLFGNRVGVYHSKYSDEERVEIYTMISANEVSPEEHPPLQIIVGARSAVLLPFVKPGLVIVDEEHEATFKQVDPAPRYHARDTAIVLAAQHGAKVLLGTATPAIETYYNAKSGKYGLVTLSERFHPVPLPAIEVIDTISMRKKKRMDGLFSQPLLAAIGKALEKREQVILFQNRRGFSPFIQCADCGYIPQCKHCSVSLTYHKQQHALVCHYCGYTERLPGSCAACGSAGIQTKGFGTEKIEEELQRCFPDARLARLDLDTTRAKHAYRRIINDFETGQKDILVGTQMVTKGLDFSRVSLVGILNADNLLNFPDFRAHERSFQLLTQVSGRAGRKEQRGQVLIQTTQPNSPVIRFVQQHDYHALFSLQLAERHEFAFPPYVRLIGVNMKHTNETVLQQAAALFQEQAGALLGGRLFGPFPPPVPRIQRKHILSFWIRAARHDNLAELKSALAQQFERLRAHQGWSGLEFVADVDPV